MRIFVHASLAFQEQLLQIDNNSTDLSVVKQSRLLTHFVYYKRLQLNFDFFSTFIQPANLLQKSDTKEANKPLPDRSWVKERIFIARWFIS